MYARLSFVAPNRQDGPFIAFTARSHSPGRPSESAKAKKRREQHRRGRCVPPSSRMFTRRMRGSRQRQAHIRSQLIRWRGAGIVDVQFDWRRIPRLFAGLRQPLAVQPFVRTAQRRVRAVVLHDGVLSADQIEILQTFDIWREPGRGDDGRVCVEVRVRLRPWRIVIDSDHARNVRNEIPRGDDSAQFLKRQTQPLIEPDMQHSGGAAARF